MQIGVCKMHCKSACVCPGMGGGGPRAGGLKDWLPSSLSNRFSRDGTETKSCWLQMHHHFDTSFFSCLTGRSINQSVCVVEVQRTIKSSNITG